MASITMLRQIGSVLVATASVTLFAGGCPAAFPGDGPSELNSTDPTNGGAKYVGSAACRACHPNEAALHAIHGHSQKLKKLSGRAPSYPPQASRAGIPAPPDGTAWTDLTYVIGGYYRKARFINSQGYVMTDGVDGINTQWNLEFLPAGTIAGWTAYHADQTAPKPYDYLCFKCHTTGPSPNGHQDSLPGIEGTFAESGVQCEACHGPGSRHVPDPPSQIYINSESSLCGTCHRRGDDMNVIPASGGFIRHHEQYQELLASPHAHLRCVTCHDSHTSVSYDRDHAIINACENCHSNQNMALHKGAIFVQGDYVERLSCESCHLPFATKSAAAASAEVIGPDGRMGDVRTHLWYINTEQVDYTAMFSDDGTTVKRDAEGKAAVTVDFVCLRCHNGIGPAFKLTVKSAGDIALQMHGP